MNLILSFRTGLLCLVAMLSSIGMFANDFYQITLQMSPTLETMNMRNKLYKGQNGYKLSYNFGIEYKYFLDPELSISTGLLFQNKGFRNIIGDAGPASEGIFTKSVVVVSTHYVSVPSNINYHIRTGNRSRVLITAGFTNGFLVNQMIEGKRIPEGEEKNLMGEEITDNRRDLDLFKRYYLGLNLGLALVKYIRAKAVLEIQPMYHRQLNKAIRSDAPVTSSSEVFTPKFDSFAIEVKLGYYFNKQIKKKGDQF